MLISVFMSLIGLIALALISALAYRTLRQYQNARALAIRTPNKIEESRFVQVGGIQHPNLNIISATLFSPHHTLKNVFALFSSFMSAPAKLFQRIMSHDARSLGTTFEALIFCFQGDTDLQTPAQPVEACFATLQAPHKDLLLLKGEGHIAVLTNPDLFLQAFVARVRPLALPKASEYAVGAERMNAHQLSL